MTTQVSHAPRRHRARRLRCRRSRARPDSVLRLAIAPLDAARSHDPWRAHPAGARQAAGRAVAGAVLPAERPARALGPLLARVVVPSGASGRERRPGRPTIRGPHAAGRRHGPGGTGWGARWSDRAGRGCSWSSLRVRRWRPCCSLPSLRAPPSAPRPRPAPRPRAAPTWWSSVRGPRGRCSPRPTTSWAPRSTPWPSTRPGGSTAGVSVRLEGVPYPAVPTSRGTAAYNASVGEGASMLHSQMVGLLRSCPRTRVALAGFSQGAHVVHRTLARHPLSTAPQPAGRRSGADRRPDVRRGHHQRGPGAVRLDGPAPPRPRRSGPAAAAAARAAHDRLLQPRGPGVLLRRLGR